MRLGFVFYSELPSFSAGKLGSARLFGVEMIKTGFSGKNLAVFGKFQSFAV